jgi:GTP-binding protein
MTANYYNQAKYLLGVAEMKQLPDDTGFEVAFAGRSNSGKSTLLNTLTSHKKLARTSKTPGRTQLLNFFVLGDDTERRLVDLPGFGYAKVSKAMKGRWQKVIYTYLEQRQCLVGVVLLMDIRHPLKPDDLMLIEWARRAQMPMHLVLTKADKLSRQQQIKSLNQVKKSLKDSGLSDFSLQVFSSVKKAGLDELYGVLDGWYEL